MEAAGISFADLLVKAVRLVMALQPDGSHVAQLVNLEPGNLELVVTIPATDALGTHPTADGGIYVVQPPGVLQEYGPDGTLIDLFDIEGIAENSLGRADMTIDPATRRLAIGVGIVLVDPTTGDVERLPPDLASSSLEFARNGERLAITGIDGTVRLWDVERGVFAGLAWRS